MNLNPIEWLYKLRMTLNKKSFNWALRNRDIIRRIIHNIRIYFFIMLNLMYILTSIFLFILLMKISRNTISTIIFTLFSFDCIFIWLMRIKEWWKERNG